jgi:hypothetical protein
MAHMITPAEADVEGEPYLEFVLQSCPQPCIIILLALEDRNPPEN